MTDTQEIDALRNALRAALDENKRLREFIEKMVAENRLQSNRMRSQAYSVLNSGATGLEEPFKKGKQ